MIPKINWNDSINDFVKIKVQRPQLLSELVRRELQYTQKRNYEKKIEERRELYEKYSSQFKAEQQQFQLKTSFKRQMQKQIAKLAFDISKLLKQLVKQESDATSLKVKSEKQLDDNLFSSRTKNIDEKSLSKESLMAEYVVIKQNLDNEIKDFLSRRTKLNEEISKLVNREHLLQKELKREQEININLDQIRKIEQQLQKQRQIKIKLKNRIEYFEQSKRRARKLRNDKEVFLDKTLKRIKDFSKQYKKIMEIAQSRKNKKYIEFVKKYRIYNFEQEKMIKYEHEVKKKKKFSILIESLDSQIFKYAQAFDKMTNHINRKFSPQEFDDLNAKCQNIQLQIVQRQNQDRYLKLQIQALKEHLIRKTKQLQMQYQKIKNK